MSDGHVSVDQSVPTFKTIREAFAAGYTGAQILSHEVSVEKMDVTDFVMCGGELNFENCRPMEVPKVKGEVNGHGSPPTLSEDLDASGVSSITQISPADEIAAAVDALATRVAASTGTHAELLVSAAIDHLAGAQVTGAERVVGAAVKAARESAKRRAQRERRAAKSSAAAREEGEERDPLEEVLPDHVVVDSDLANAHRLRRDHGDDLRFNSALGWLAWDGRRWARPGDAEAARRMHWVARGLEAHAAELLAAAARSPEDTVAARLRAQSATYAKWAGKSQQARQISSGLAIARTLDGIDCGPADFDRDGWLFNCANGTLDLRTGALQPHRRQHMITRISPVTFDLAAQCPRWERFLVETLPDEDVRTFVQRFFGYSLTGSMAEQCIAVLYGHGANGKSTFLEVGKFVLGDYATEAAGETFLLDSKKGRATDNKLADLRGARLVSSSESGEERRLDETLVKRVSGGDELTANHLYRETFRFHAQFKLWLATNHRPEIRGVDDGVWRRLRLIPFNVTIPPERREGDLPEQLRAEASGILSWAVQGCLDWQKFGLQAPAAVSACTAEWRATEDELGAFIDDCCAVAQFAKSTAGALYGAYREWAERQGGKPISAKAFGLRLKRLGYMGDKTHAQGRMWCGIGLRQPERDA